MGSRSDVREIAVPSGEVLCLHCGRAFRQVSWAHLVYRHDYPFDSDAVAEYKRRFGLRLVTCDETRVSVSNARVADWDAKGRKWTRESLLDTLRQMREAGENLSGRWMGDHRGVIYLRAREFFGSYAAALEAAGIDPEDVRAPIPPRPRMALCPKPRPRIRKLDPSATRRREWTRECVVQTIRERLASDRALHVTALLAEDPTLYHKGREFFGSWKEALAAAEVPAQAVFLRGCWTPERIIEEVRRRHTAGLPLNSTAAAKDGLLHRAMRVFGNWSAALSAAGIDPDAVRRGRRPWTKDEIVQGILVFHRKGEPLHHCAMARTHRKLLHAAMGRFGSWYAALEASGLDPASIRRGMPDGSPIRKGVPKSARESLL